MKQPRNDNHRTNVQYNELYAYINAVQSKHSKSVPLVNNEGVLRVRYSYFDVVQ